MEQIIQTFQPTATSDQSSFWAGIMVAILALAGMVFLLLRPAKQGDRNRRLLVAMLSFFVFLIAASTAFFSWWSMEKTGPVHFYAAGIQTPYGKVKFQEIRNAYIHQDKEKSLVNPNVVTRATNILVIEEISGKTHALSEAQYPISQILGRLKNELKGKKE